MPAWYLRGRRSTWVILIHGLGGSRTDTLPAMPILHALGYPMLAISYRNDLGATPITCDHKSHLGATGMARRCRRNQLRDPGHGASGVVLYGYSLGAAMALVAARDPSISRHVLAVVLDSPVLDWRATLDYAARRRGIPHLLTKITETLVAWRAGLDFSEFPTRCGTSARRHPGAARPR